VCGKAEEEGGVELVKDPTAGGKAKVKTRVTGQEELRFWGTSWCLVGFSFVCVEEPGKKKRARAGFGECIFVFYNWILL